MVEIAKIIEILTPALSALAGGLIVILGNIVIHNLQKENTNRVFLSEQIEPMGSNQWGQTRLK